MYKPHHKPKPKTSDISKQSPSPLHHTFLLGRACFTAQPLSALLPTEYEFQFQPSAESLHPTCTVEQIKQSSSDWELITFFGKALHLAEPTVVGAKNLKLIESTFADTTGQITVNLWAELTQEVETGKVYRIAPIQVRSWNGIKKLSTTPNSVITSVSDQAELTNLPIPEPTPDSEQSANGILNVPSIHSVHSVETFVHCINCGRRLLQATAAKFIQCQRCSAYMRTANCSKKLCARIVVQSDDTLLHLTAFEDVLKEVFPDLATMSEASLAELILEMESVTITYDTTNRTIKKLSTEK